MTLRLATGTRIARPPSDAPAVLIGVADGRLSVADATGLIGVGRTQIYRLLLCRHRGRSPDPYKKPTLTTARWWPAGVWPFRCVTASKPSKQGSGGDQPSNRSATSARSRGSAVARGPALRRQTRCLEVVRRSPPRRVPALPMRRVGGLLRLDVLQHGRQPLVVDDRAGLHCLDLVERTQK
jgi:hypothetical protein